MGSVVLTAGLSLVLAAGCNESRTTAHEETNISADDLDYTTRRPVDTSYGVYDQVSTIDPEYVSAYRYREVFIRLTDREYDKAILDLTKAIAIDSGFAEAYRYRGVLYAGKDQYDRAISDFTKAIAMNPKHGPAYSHRASYYLLRRDYGNAWADVERARSLRASVPPALINQLREASDRQEYP